MTSPRMARAILSLSARAEELDALVGDLEEVHRQRLTRRGRLAASILTTLEAAGIGLGEVRHRVADAATGQWISGAEFRLALRLLRRTPLMTTTSVFALAVGVAVATIGFTAIDAILHPSLPFAGGSRWVTIEALDADSRRARSVTPELFASWRQEASRLVHVGAVLEDRANLALSEDRVSVVSIARVTPGTMTHLPFRPLLGRSFSLGDARPGAPPVVLLTESLWARLFDRETQVVGRALSLGDRRFTVVGVLPDDAIYPTLADVWIAWPEPALNRQLADANSGIAVYGLLADGADPDDAEGQISGLTRDWSYARADLPTTTSVVRRVGDATGGGAPAALLIGLLVGALGVIAGNVGNLVIARTAARSGELAVRSALGASRRRIIGQLAFEVLVMTMLASGIGFGATRVLFGYLGDRRTRDLPITMDFSVSPRTALFVFAATLFVAVIAGLMPAIRTTRPSADAALRSAGRGQPNAMFGWLGQSMIVVQIALSVGVLGAAGMVHRGWMGAYVDSTLDVPAERLLLAALTLPSDVDAGERERLAQEYLRRLRDLPDVRAAAFSTHTPGTDAPSVAIELDDPDPARRRVQRVPTARVGPTFFSAVGHDVVAGRLFRDEDFDDDAPRVAVVNGDYAAQVLQDRNPIGTRVREAGTPEGDEEEWFEVVGVVAGPDLSAADPDRTGGLFLPLRDATDMQMIVRTGDRPVAIAPLARAAAYGLHPGLLVTNEAVLSDRLQTVRRIYLVMGSVLTGLGAVVLILSLVAVYALLSFEVTRRTREIGVRVALGAERADVVFPIASRIAVYAALGGGVGSLLGTGLVWVARETLVLRFPATGPVTFLALAGLILASALFASLVPVRRALRIRPMDALRAD